MFTAKRQKKHWFFSASCSGAMVTILPLAAAFLLLSVQSLKAAEISIGDFLATAKQDYLLDYQHEKIDFLHDSSSNTPFLERIEFRAGTSEGTHSSSRQRYGVRIYPTGWGESSNGKKVYDTSLDHSTAQHDLLLHQAIKKRYVLVVDFLHSEKMLELQNELLVLYKDKGRVLRQSQNNINFDFNDLIEAENEYTSLQLEQVSLKESMRSIGGLIQAYLPSDNPVEFDTKNMAGIDAMKNIIEQVRSTPESENAYLRESSVRTELAEKRHQLEESENRRFLRFFEASYDEEERNDSDDKFFFRLGIKLPFINSGKLDVNRRKLAYLTEKGRNEELKRTLSESQRVLYDDLKRLIEQHEVMTKRKEEINFESSLKTYSALQGVTPLVLLKIRESMLQNDRILETIRHEFCTTYIELLDVTGALSAKPLRNYLSSDQENL